MDNNEKDSSERYFDFSEEEEVIEAFSPGSRPEEWLGTLSGELQRAFRRKNPTTAIKSLLAFGISAQAHLLRSILKQIRMIYFLLILNVVLLGAAVYLIAKS